jgi:hypothetical protein
MPSIVRADPCGLEGVTDKACMHVGGPVGCMLASHLDRAANVRTARLTLVSNKMTQRPDLAMHAAPNQCAQGGHQLWALASRSRGYSATTGTAVNTQHSCLPLTTHSQHHIRSASRCSAVTACSWKHAAARLPVTCCQLSAPAPASTPALLHLQPCVFQARLRAAAAWRTPIAGLGRTASNMMVASHASAYHPQLPMQSPTSAMMGCCTFHPECSESWCIAAMTTCTHQD